MESDIPVDVRPTFAELAVQKLENLRNAGWYVSPIRWVDAMARTVGFSAKKNGQGVYIVCSESDLANRLKLLAETSQ